MPQVAQKCIYIHIYYSIVPTKYKIYNIPFALVVRDHNMLPKVDVPFRIPSIINTIKNIPIITNEMPTDKYTGICFLCLGVFPQFWWGFFLFFKFLFRLLIALGCIVMSNPDNNTKTQKRKVLYEYI